jgi:ABC-2 type transport system permease protein
MRRLRAWTTLVWISFRRLLWSANTLMALAVLTVCGLGVFAYANHRLERLLNDGPERAFRAFSEEVVLGIFTLFVAPICAIAFATTSIGGDREDRTLLFLLVRPIPRWLVLMGKWCATLPIALGLVVGGFWLYCRMAGETGQLAYQLYLPAIFGMTTAYVGLFHLFAVLFRHSTILALLYSMFMEFFLGNMPGIIKRVAVNFYARSLMLDAGTPAGMEAPPPEFFAPVSGPTAAWALAGISLISLLIGLVIFQRREYRDLT